MNRLILLGLFATLLSGCSGFFLGEPNLAEPEKLPSNPNEVNVSRHWQQKIGKGTADSTLRLTPKVIGDRVYMVSADGLLRAFSLDTGERQWQRQLGHAISAGVAGDTTSPATNSATSSTALVVGTENGVLMAFSSTDGSPLWSYPLSTEIIASPTVTNGRVIARTIDGQVTALTADRGEVLWKQDIGVADLTIRGNAEALNLGEVLLFTNGRGTITVLSIADGRPVLTAPVVIGRGMTEVQRIADLLATPTINEGVLFLSAYRHKTLAIDLQSGGLVWEQAVASALDLFADSRYVYVVDKDSIIYALNQKDGKVAWQSEVLKGRRISPLSGDGVHLLTVDMDGQLVALDSQDGSLLAYESVGKSRAHIAPLRFDQNRWLTFTRDGRLTQIELSAK
ncbi:outer membrane protein assembly factor BamB [Ostreibacterium oceani]|uniref:Outer membrane protein assembly factor BamB n=1 Tax=Ostreibacterium oceani TaxID=2654998 RepID=A0A6N7EWD3_9GAMM|nr:outer membrane protein assembly factor BamB [Ostreibacterium oceani]MPV85860.1 outer membrane protein assembly factor BamB [Ostreibacterium oceani]